MEDNKEASRRYRELGREEPPPELDARIRAEARSALEVRTAPLVPPTGRRHWYFPVAAAAVIMLAVAVTSQVEREQPQEAAVQEKQKVEERKTEEAKPERRLQADSLAKRPEPRPFAQAPKDQVAPPAPAGERAAGAERSRDEFSRDNRARQERPAASPPAPAPASPAASAANVPSQAQEAEKPGKLRADVASGAMARAKVAEAPEAWLERIARLRADGRDDEADKALAEFRKQYPDYKIPPDTLKKVERQK